MALPAVLLFLACIFHMWSGDAVVAAVETNDFTHLHRVPDTTHPRRELQVPVLMIALPTNGDVVNNTTIDVVINCGTRRFRRIEVLMDGNIIAGRSRPRRPWLSGKVTLRVDLTRATDGPHSLKARGRFAYSTRTLRSRDVSITVRSSALSKVPTKSPIKSEPTKAPTKPPTRPPTMPPTVAPGPPKPQTNPITKAPTRAPMRVPTKAPTKDPTKAPTKAPTKPPTKAPTNPPTKPPTRTPIPLNRLQGYPKTIVVNTSTIIALTVDLTGLNATGIDSFYVYRVDPVSQVVNTTRIVELRDVGSGAGNDTVAGDKIYSDILAIRSALVGETFGFQAVPVIRGNVTVNTSLTFRNLNTTYSIGRNSTNNSTTLTNASLPAGRIDGLILIVEYSWPADQDDLDSGTVFLGNRTGFACGGNSTYMNFTDDDTGYGGKERVNVFLGRSYRDLKWNTSTTVNMNAGWHRLPHRGPASISMWTVHAYDNGTTINDNNLVSFGFDPGVQDGCSNTTIAMANVTSSGQVTFINVTQLK